MALPIYFAKSVAAAARERELHTTVHRPHLAARCEGSLERIELFVFVRSAPTHIVGPLITTYKLVTE